MLKILKGVFLAAFAGCCWGSMAVAAQYLFTDCGFQARHLTTLRLIGAGVLLLALQAAFGGSQSILKPFKEKRNIQDILIYGVGVLLIQYTFFLAIEQSNAGTAAIMVGVGPLFIIGYLAVCKHRKPVPKEFFCLFLAISGVACCLLLSGLFAPCSLKTLSLESAFQMLWVGAWSSEEPLPVSLPIPLQWMFIGQSRLFFVISRSLRLEPLLHFGVI